MRAAVLASTLFLAACPAPSATRAPADEAPKAAPSSQPAETSKLEKGTTPATRDQVDPDGVVRRGVAVPHDEAMTVAALIEQGKGVDGEKVTVTGEVTEVCTKKGCWMALRAEEGGPSVRVTSEGYAYFVPADAKGKNATVTGKASVKVLDAETAEHYAKESAHAKPTAGSVEVAIASVGLEIRP